MAESAQSTPSGREGDGSRQGVPTAQPATATAPDAFEVTPPPPGGRPEDRPPHVRLWSYLASIARGVWRKGEQDNIFFLAGAISFNVLVAFLPLLLAILGIAGTVLRGQRADRAMEVLVTYLQETVPVAVDLPYEDILASLAENSTGILSIGTLIFLWVATRLVGTLRTVLREIFDIPEGRGIIAGKVFDIKMVFMAGTLFIANVWLTLGLRWGAEFGSRITGIQPEDVSILGQATNWWPQILAFWTIWVMFLLVYRYLPPRRIRWSTAVIAASFTSVVVEALKYGFTLYVENIADFAAFWGNVATFVILVLWIYYTSVVFILGGQVAQVVSMHRTRKRQRERLA